MEWKSRVTFTVGGRPEQRGSKNPLVMKRWTRGKGGGDNSIVFRGPVQVKTLPDGTIRVYGDPMLVVPDDNPKSKKFMQIVHRAARLAWGQRELIEGAAALGVRFYFKRPKGHYRTGQYAALLRDDAPTDHAQSPDLAKLIRSLEDALTGAIWKDDRLVCRYIEPERFWISDGSCERTEIEVFTRGEAAEKLF